MHHQKISSDFVVDEPGVFWPVVRPWIEDACTKGDAWWTIEALEDLVTDGKALLWVLSDNGIPIAAVITAICQWENRRVAEIYVTGGEGVISECPHHFEKIHAWAREAGAGEMFVRGRRGWARALKPYGYDEIAVTLRKAL